ncbi:MAG: N-acetylmuramoyl-L-alanine amidase [Longimicrobiales bacterium]|nr:N-acetylmuramoyl-L-alanine amidase [Longimicrobiales bacterium]
MRPRRWSLHAGFVALALLFLAGGTTETSQEGPTNPSAPGDDVEAPSAPANDVDASSAAVSEVDASSATVREAESVDPAVQSVESQETVEPGESGETVESLAPTAPAAPEVRRGSSDGNDRRRRYRRRYRNRYPGPIPTPAEWRPPGGPVKIALQAGHWRAGEAPAELSGLRDNGTRWEDIHEWEANLEVARRTAALLETSGYEVEILPAVVPPGYRAHLFVSIHADGSLDTRASGYRVASPRRDATGRAADIASLLERSYGKATGLRHITTSTRRMRNYYAFNFRRYEHALHPMTIAVILETGFLTSPRDRGVIVDDPDRAARGIVEAIRAFPVTALPAVADGESDSIDSPDEEPAEDATDPGTSRPGTRTEAGGPGDPTSPLGEGSEPGER